MTVLVGVFVGVFVGVIVGVTVLVGVFVGVLVGVFVEVLVGVTVFVGVLVAVLVGVLVGVIDGVTVFVGVLVGVFVAVLVGVIVGVTVLVGVFVGVLVGVIVGVGVGVVFSEQITNVAPDNVPTSTAAKSSINNCHRPFETGGCNPSKIVNSGELPVEKVVGHGAENGIELDTKVLFLKVPELKPSQVGELKLVKVTLALIASLTPPILPDNNDQLVLSGATNNIPTSPTAVCE